MGFFLFLNVNKIKVLKVLLFYKCLIEVENSKCIYILELDEDDFFVKIN